MIFSQNRKVYASLCGVDAKLSLIGSLMLIEDSLTEYMEKLKIDGITAMNKYNAIIVFIKNHIKFFKDVEWNNDITIESFISSKSKIRFCIDTCIKDSFGDICVYSSIQLCGLDLQTKQIRKCETFGVDGSIESENPQCEIVFDNNVNYEVKPLEDVKVKASNIDYVHHTNNIEYIRFIINTFTVDELLNNSFKEIEINYLNQSYEGDNLTLFSNSSSNDKYFVIKKEDIPVLKCHILIEKK